MHTPPTVEFPVAPSRWFQWTWGLLWAIALIVPLMWLWRAGPGEWAPWFGLFVALAAAVVATRAGRVVGTGALIWDANTWYWERGSTRTSGALTPELDLQNMLLLRFVSDVGQQHWFWLERGMAPPHWLALRRAVLAQRGSRASDGSSGHHRKDSDRVVRP